MHNILLGKYNLSKDSDKKQVDILRKQLLLDSCEWATDEMYELLFYSNMFEGATVISFSTHCQSQGKERPIIMHYGNIPSRFNKYIFIFYNNCGGRYNIKEQKGTFLHIIIQI